MRGAISLERATVAMERPASPKKLFILAQREAQATKVDRSPSPKRQYILAQREAHATEIRQRRAQRLSKVPRPPWVAIELAERQQKDAQRDEVEAAQHERPVSPARERRSQPVVMMCTALLTAAQNERVPKTWADDDVAGCGLRVTPSRCVPCCCQYRAATAVLAMSLRAPCTLLSQCLWCIVSSLSGAEQRRGRVSGLWSALVMLAQASGLSDLISDAAVTERLNSIARVMTRGAMELYSEPAPAAIIVQTGTAALQRVSLSIPVTRSIAVLSLLRLAQCSLLT